MNLQEQLEGMLQIVCILAVITAPSALSAPVIPFFVWLICMLMAIGALVPLYIVVSLD